MGDGDGKGEVSWNGKDREKKKEIIVPVIVQVPSRGSMQGGNQKEVDDHGGGKAGSVVHECLTKKKGKGSEEIIQKRRIIRGRNGQCRQSAEQEGGGGRRKGEIRGAWKAKTRKAWEEGVIIRKD